PRPFFVWHHVVNDRYSRVQQYQQEAPPECLPHDPKGWSEVQFLGKKNTQPMPQGQQSERREEESRSHHQDTDGNQPFFPEVPSLGHVISAAEIFHKADETGRG